MCNATTTTTTKNDMSNTKNNDDKNNAATQSSTRKQLSTMKLILGHLSYSSLVCLIISMNLWMLIGTYKYPTSIGLITLAYYTYILAFDHSDSNGSGRPWPWFSEHFPLLYSMRTFLQLKLIGNDKLTALDQGRVVVAQPAPGSRGELTEQVQTQQKQQKPPPQMILACFPHGTNVDYRLVMEKELSTVLPNTAPNVRYLGASILFRLPLLREICLWTRCIDASKSSATKALSKGKSIFVVPGGQAEQIMTETGKESLYLSRRKGFVKLALKYEIPIVPMYVFGCSDMYTTFTFAKDLQLWLVKTLGISIPLAVGHLGSPICPKPIPTTIVFGEPLHVSKHKQVEPAGTTKEITEAELNAAHEEVCNAVKELFDTHKGRLGYGDRELEIM